MFDWGTGKTEYRLSIFPDDSPAIDFVLDEQMVRKIYSSWVESEHGELVDFGGGVRAITAKMVYEAGEEFLKTIKGIGEIRASIVMEELDLALKESPYGNVV